MGLLWGNEKKTCPDCGMEIPSSAKICPFCHREFKDSLFSDIHQHGCLGFPLMLLFILGGFMLISKCGFESGNSDISENTLTGTNSVVRVRNNSIDYDRYNTHNEVSNSDLTEDDSNYESPKTYFTEKTHFYGETSETKVLVWYHPDGVCELILFYKNEDENVEDLSNKISARGTYYLQDDMIYISWRDDRLDQYKLYNDYYEDGELIMYRQ